ncbi:MULTISPECIES: ATP-binding protein [unclassified Butyrivibrio]|uniref:ATP-binding protein n=1 Tax=unclassified Butyrivibrio TaxID=2639466 RepID=UPI00047BC3A6|nr:MULTISPECIES: ATP-binding protein [unclassified Butyrivibrio]
MINSIVHNHWVEQNAPSFTAYKDRLEILSRGNLPPKQTMEGFFLGESVPVNRKLSDIFLQLHISERSGRGIPRTVGKYGRDAIEFRDNTILVTIPFDRLQQDMGTKAASNTVNRNDRSFDRSLDRYAVDNLA